MTARARPRKKQLDDRIQSLKDQIDYQYELGNNRLAEILKDELQFEINNNNRLKINNINIKNKERNKKKKIFTLLIAAAIADVVYLVTVLLLLLSLFSREWVKKKNVFRA
jgi:membrane-bound ClpP family serine protease